MKLCCKCKTEPRAFKTGSYCVECQRGYSKKYYKEHPEKFKPKDAEKYKQYQKGYRKKNREYFRSYMKEYYKEHPKTHEVQKGYCADWYRANKDKAKESSKNLYRKRRDEWCEILAGHGLKIKCSKCGFDKCVAALDFHHIDPSTKNIEFWTIFQRKPTPERIQQVLEESEKCSVLCANCHRMEHYSNPSR